MEFPLLEPNQADTSDARRHAPKIQLEEAQQLVDLGLAERLLKRGKVAIKLLRATSPQLMCIRGTSCKMGSRVIEAFAIEGKYRAAVQGWWNPLLRNSLPA